ncbi:sensor histidine kinase [Salinimicrobium oceani]|uniref:Histidine kinase n=1 Tax=Salinimicrobium oceani TaxID=2722702 RepID=A0ABX1CUD6_9FLAO|nr:histidine kinase [Salinimicrobium oceani]NJW51382.1 histidine kinase [Salinimicrobium oceani]
MPSYKIIKFLFFCLFWFNLSFSQNFPSKNYTAANDLPNNAVRSILVDSNNILWIGTENGVVKKENEVFKYFFEEDGLALNSCWAIEEDKNGKIWFGSYGGGVSVYDGYNFKVIAEQEGLVHNEITKLYAFEDKMLVGTSDGVSIIDINTFKVWTPETPPGNELFRIQNFFEYRGETYVVSYISGVYRIDLNRPELIKVNGQKYIYSVLVDNDSIFSSNKGYYLKHSLAEFTHEKTLPSEKRMGKSIIWDYVKTINDEIFAGAWGIYDANGGIYELKDQKMNPRMADFEVPSKEVVSLAYDQKFERLYVGTKDAGLFEIALNPQIKFNEIEGKNILGFAKTGNTAATLFDDGVLIRGTAAGKKISLPLFKNWQENFVSRTKMPLPKLEDHFYELDYSTRAEDIKFYDIKDAQQSYWVNTNIGIFVVKESGELERYLPLHSEEINFTEQGKLIETHPYGGVRLYDDLDAFNYTYFEPDDPLTPTMVVNSLSKKKKTYFLSIFSGLYTWEKGKFKSYLENGAWQEKKLKHITAVGDNLAISNEFGDVFLVNDDHVFTLLEKIPRAKINGNTISFLKAYDGTLLIGTEKGLTLYKEHRYIFLDEEQGLDQPLLSAKVNGSVLSIGSKNGIYNIDLDAVIESQALIDEVNLKEVYINNSKISVGPLNTNERLELAHDENTILIKFSTNAHPFPQKLKYQYRLSSNDNWSLPTSSPEIFLPSLPSDKYNIHVKILDESTGFSYSQPLLSLAILPPFWKTWWFGFFIASLIVVATLVIYRYQLEQTHRFEEQKGQIQKRFEETKMEALLAQMNPHFIFNAMNSIQYYIVENDIDNATRFLSDFAKLIRLNLDHCTKPTILLSEEIEYLQSYIRVENTRFNNAIEVKLQVDSEIDIYDVEIPTMLLQTFIENVFVHAFPTSIVNPTLHIQFQKLADDILQCKIEDNGVGYNFETSNKLHKSKGVNLVKERLALLGYEVDKSVKILSSKNGGTSILLELKI